MKVFGCKVQVSYGGGVILVAANTVEEAFLTAASKSSYLFEWRDDRIDGDINHVVSDAYPFSAWHEVKHLQTDLTKPQVILEESYYE